MKETKKLIQNKVVDFTAYKIIKDIQEENRTAAKSEFYGEDEILENCNKKYSLTLIGDSINGGCSNVIGRNAFDEIPQSAKEEFNAYFTIRIETRPQPKTYFWSIIGWLFLAAFVIGMLSK